MTAKFSRVPTMKDVVTGALVNIVLKADQRTGRTVNGTVRDVLTRGDHPRGIKVRLADGRVGRVQSMAVPGPAAQPQQDAGDVAVIGTDSTGAGGPPRRQWQFGARDVREEDELPVQSVGLDAYIKPAKTKGARKTPSVPSASKHNAVDRGGSESRGSSGESQGVNAQSGAATCPVCGEFEGDEAAVAHHVASHFDS